jgi:hypothetical protein
MAVEAAAALFLATAVSDALGFAAASFYLLVLGVPLTAAAGLICFGRVVDAVNGGGGDLLGGMQAALAGVLVVVVVIGAAARAPAVPADRVPIEATALLVLGFALLVVQALIALAPAPRQLSEDERPHGPLAAFDP